MFPAPVCGADNHDERLPVLGHKLGDPFRCFPGYGRKTLLGCLELASRHNPKVRYSVLSVQNLNWDAWDDTAVVAPGGTCAVGSVEEKNP